MLKLSILLFSFIAFIGYSQNISVESKDSIKGQFDQFTVDNFGNIYLVKQDVIIKLNSKLDTLFIRSLKTIVPHYIEASKSFRVLTFDKDRGVVQFLDNTLTPLSSELNLYNLNLVQPILVCESFNGNAFWVLDAGTLRLLKLNEKFEIITEVDNLSFYLKTKQLPNQMFEYKDQLYMVVPGQQILVFDAFGTLIHKWPFDGQWLDLRQKGILKYSFPFFQFLDLPFFIKEEKLKWSISGVLSFKLTQKKLFVLSKQGFYVAKLKINK